MTLSEAIATIIPLVEAEMRALLSPPSNRAATHYEIMLYHMGWRDEALSPAHASAGKRIRPLLCVLACLAAGGRVEQAVPAAAGLELLHNFSLIHDDIEDNSTIRRHRRTTWNVFGMPMALNAGDGMLSLAHASFLHLLDRGLSAQTTLSALRCFDATCIALTEGQYLDMSFEGRTDVTVDDYYAMIAGKTGALLAAAPEIGAIVAGASAETIAAYREYGAALGLAFQLQDDILGIWGDAAETGKSSATDILSKKMTFPVLHALSHEIVGPSLLACYAHDITPAEVPAVLALLDRSDARGMTERARRAASAGARAALARLAGTGDAIHQALLSDLLDSLDGRRS